MSATTVDSVPEGSSVAPGMNPLFHSSGISRAGSLSYPLLHLRMENVRHSAWRRLFPPDQPSPLRKLSLEAQQNALQATREILGAHRKYLAEFRACADAAREAFDQADWKRSAQNSEHRVGLYRTALTVLWANLQRQFPNRLNEMDFWMGVRQILLERVFDDYDADLALTFFYSTLRIAFDASDIPVEYADDGLAERDHLWRRDPVFSIYPASPEVLSQSVREILERCGFHSPFEDSERDSALAAERLLGEWRRVYEGSPADLQMLKPVFFRDQEAYLVGRLRSGASELPVVLALRHEDPGITIEAVLAGKEDMRTILFVSTRSTFHVPTDEYREVLRFVDDLAPERGHPAMCAVIGFTHPARVALNQRLRRHLSETGERFALTPGRVGTAMVVFSPPSFPYVFKVIRDTSTKVGWTGRERIMDLYRWVHETNRGRLMLDAWMYRNLHFPRSAFDENVLADLLLHAPSSVRVDGGLIVLKHVYAQRRVLPLNTLLDETTDRTLLERAIDALGRFIKDLARMGFFVGEHYGLTFNTGLTHASNVVLFDFDDLDPLLKRKFRQTPEMDEKDEMLWNSEIDGSWFSVGENDVLVDEWERYLGVPVELRDYFRRKHGELFTVDYWLQAQQRVSSGELHYVQPYPRARRLVRNGAPVQAQP